MNIRNITTYNYGYHIQKNKNGRDSIQSYADRYKKEQQTFAKLRAKRKAKRKPKY